MTGVAAGVAVTTAGGVLLSWLRARSGRLAAPVLLHLTINCGGLAAAWADRGRGPPPEPEVAGGGGQRA